MKELAGEDLVYERRMWPRDEALQFFAAKGEPLKVQLIEEKTEGQSDVSVYTIKDRETFVDFCVGPHVPSTGRLKAFKLLTTSNAYWKGDARNQPMQRISGTAFLSDAELKAHLQRVEEAKKVTTGKSARNSGSSWSTKRSALDCRSGCQKGDDSSTVGGLHRREGTSGRLRARLHAGSCESGFCTSARAIGITTMRTCSRRWSSRPSSSCFGR